MRVLVLGGTGSIGTSVVDALHRRNHEVSVLCRSDASAEKARALGAAVVGGSIEAPDGWIEQLVESDAVIHLATGFGPDAGDVDRDLLDALFTHATDHRLPGSGRPTVVGVFSDTRASTGWSFTRQMSPTTRPVFHPSS
ncbi:MAG: NAD-dependent epimerase/dehydratase family protein [Spirochaetaceae bacterium]